MSLGLLLGIGASLLLAAIGMGAVLAFVFSRFFPIGPPPPEAAEEATVEPVDEATLAARKAAYRRGIYVFVGLAVLTAIEFGIAIALDGSAALLFIAALAKAGLVIQYYMHLNNVWSEEEAH